MNAIQLLKNEHETAKRAFGRIRAARAEQRGELWATLKPELNVHEQIEEEALYGPVAREVGPRDSTLKDWHAHHRGEVRELEALIHKIDESDPATDQWMDRVVDLQEKLEHHIQEEEGRIWPRIQQAWDRSKLEQAGQQLEAMKRERLSRAA
jgi:hemerythrin-like domain-containing protein